MKTLPLLIVSAVFAALAHGAAAKEKITFEDLLLEDGTMLKNALVLKVEPDGLRLEHSSGVSKVKYENLPEAVQKQFTFDREKAEEFRQQQDSVRETREAAERKARVEEILEKRREEQDDDVLRSREAFFQLLATNEYSYPQLERSLIESIAILKEAGRKDLAALLEDDRKLLRERELLRGGDKYQQERDQLLARIRDLEHQLAQLNPPGDLPVDDYVVTETVVPFYLNPPVIINSPVVVDHPRTHPGPCPPVSRPVATPFWPQQLVPQVNPAPRRSSLPAPVRPQPFVPQGNPAPRRSSLPVSPSVPARPVVMPSSGAQIQGAHLWKK